MSVSSAASLPRIAPPQSFTSSYAPRLRAYANALLTPITEKPNVIPPIRTTKRGTTLINYAEDGFGSEADDGEDGGRRLTGLRSRRDDAGPGGAALAGQDKGSHWGREAFQPVDVQGIWRDWMGKSRTVRTPKQAQTQCALPVNLIPIRIDIDIAPFRPEPPLPTPPHNQLGGMRIDESLPAYRQPEMTPGYRLKDVFMWNLWETLTTPDQFAKVFVEELDFEPARRLQLTQEIARQIREQLEQHAATALHPLFQVEDEPAQEGHDTAATTNGDAAPTPQVNGTPSVSAVAIQAPEPSDTYRCILQLSINLQSHLYTDRVEWSLVHPPGAAETFARLTCNDLGLPTEWTTPIAHAMAESVLRLRKEAADMGIVPIVHAADGAVATLTGALLDNDAASEITGAGWRYEPESLAAEWAPKLEALSKEEIEKREGDRERRLRRARRETARMLPPAAADNALMSFAKRAADDDEPGAYGRGERSRKKRRYRSLSPLGRDTPDSAGGAGGGGGGAGGGGAGGGGAAATAIGALSEAERARWRCDWCKVWGAAVWGTRDGPDGPNTLCHSCGFLLERDKRLPPWNEGMFAAEWPAGAMAPRR